MLREHILHELKRNKFEDLGELFKSPLVSDLLPALERRWHINKDNEMPDSIDKLDISKSFALIQNIFRPMPEFNYNEDKFECVNQLRIMRNEEYGHMLIFETDDIAFSTAVVRLEEIIRQLCDYDPKVSEVFLKRIERVLDKDSNQIKELKSSMLESLAKQKEEFQLFIDDLVSKLKNSSDETMNIFSKQLENFKKGLSIDVQKLALLIEKMKGHEESRSILLQVRISAMDSKLDKLQEGKLKIRLFSFTKWIKSFARNEVTV